MLYGWYLNSVPHLPANIIEKKSTDSFFVDTVYIYNTAYVIRTM